ncbi:hypothetical protein EUX98_g8734 [Antrodiella citrinella]|uniref:2OGFeDO JBP1/TET oxygenase domain-containing protein n=1 Tax=Antrodiella citrinella TaxID=2447956 RepID=A0A4S4M5N8_9APHY|nr:hypothetical protein EUX98_g8734 [Antrodiella citrinella]
MALIASTPGLSTNYMYSIDVADYMAHAFTYILNRQACQVQPIAPEQYVNDYERMYPGTMDPEFRKECLAIVCTLVRAFVSPVRMPWDAHAMRQRMAEARYRDRDDLLKQEFPSPFPTPTVIQTPRTIVDSEGRVLVWAIPGALSNKRQQQIYKSARHLQNHFVQGCEGGRWRTDPQYFNNKLVGALRSGTLNLSPAWYSVGHRWAAASPLRSTPLFKNPNKSGLGPWTEEMRDAHAIVSGMLYIMHPELFENAREVVNNIWDNLLGPRLAMWGLPFTAASLMSNRASINHRDKGGWHTMLDMLVTTGPYSRSYLTLPDLDISVDYRPGTVVSLYGGLIRHGVGIMSEARLCNAYYFRDSVMARADVEYPDYMSQHFYSSYVPVRHQEHYLGGGLRAGEAGNSASDLR